MGYRRILFYLMLKNKFNRLKNRYLKYKRTYEQLKVFFKKIPPFLNDSFIMIQKIYFSWLIEFSDFFIELNYVNNNLKKLTWVQLYLIFEFNALTLLFKFFLFAYVRVYRKILRQMYLRHRYKKRIKKELLAKERKGVREQKELLQLYRRSFYFLYVLWLWPTPKRIKRFLFLCVARLGGFFRSTFVIFITHNWDHKWLKFYLITNCVLFFFIKLYQEIRFYFDCPLAVLLYGIFIRRPRKPKKPKKEDKPKLHKFVRDPFAGKAERLKKIAEREAKQKILEEKKRVDLVVDRKKRAIYKKPLAAIMKKDLRSRRKMR